MKIKSLYVLCFIAAAFLLSSCSSITNSLGGKETPELFPIVQNRKLGYMNRQGEVVIEPQFRLTPDSLRFFSEGLAGVCLDAGKCGYIDNNGKFVVNPQFQRVEDFSEGLAAVLVEGKLGYIDKTGKFVINPQFEAGGRQESDFINTFSEGLASVKIGDKYGFIDQTGKIVINPQFEFAFPFSEGLAAVIIGRKGGFVDKEGKIVVNPQFDEVRPLVNGLAVVAIDKKYGFVDKTGKIIINPQFDYALPFSPEGLAFVVTGKNLGPEGEGKSGYIDKEGKYVINPQFAVRGGPFFASLFSFNRKYKFKVFEFSEGLASVVVGDKMGYIDATGKIVINPQFRAAYSFNGGLAAVESDAGLAYIDKEGKYVWRETKEVVKTSSNTNKIDINVTAPNTANTNTTANTSKRTGRLTTDSNIRSDSNKDAASLGIHFKGAKLEILDETTYMRDDGETTWYKVRITEYGCSVKTELGCGKNSESDADEGWLNAKNVLLD